MRPQTTLNANQARTEMKGKRENQSESKWNLRRMRLQLGCLATGQNSIAASLTSLYHVVLHYPLLVVGALLLQVISATPRVAQALRMEVDDIKRETALGT